MSEKEQVTISKEEYEALKRANKKSLKKKNKKQKQLSFKEQQKRAKNNKKRKEFLLKVREERTRELANSRAKELRLNSTESEKIFKVKLKLSGFNYCFQYPLYTENTFYIADFYLPKYRLIIEIDGEYHDDPKQRIKDNHRTKDIEKLGLKVLRINNSSVKEMSENYFKELILKYRA